MKIERGKRSSSPKQESNQYNSILCDTPEKANKVFEVIAKYEDYLIERGERPPSPKKKVKPRQFNFAY